MGEVRGPGGFHHSNNIYVHEVLFCCSQINSHDQVRGHRTRGTSLRYIQPLKSSPNPPLFFMHQVQNVSNSRPTSLKYFYKTCMVITNQTRSRCINAHPFRDYYYHYKHKTHSSCETEDFVETHLYHSCYYCTCHAVPKAIFYRCLLSHGIIKRKKSLIKSVLTRSRSQITPQGGGEMCR